ncbi:MAG: ptlE, partial [Rickettsiaceae bacterium]|nr:ptlE [Rickettsiaceae bacterium]
MLSVSNDTNKEIAEKIRDGSYYTDAREWYTRQYLYPITERTFLVIIASVVCFVFILSVANIKSLITENPIIPFPIKVENAADYFSFIKPLSQNSENTQEAVAQHLIEDYLRTREEYIPSEMRGDKLKHKLKKIKSSSSKTVLDEYKNYMSELNPYSPVIRYGDDTTRSINIKSFKFIGNDAASGKAHITFESVTKKPNEEPENKSLWEATVLFRLPDIETIAHTGAPLRF